MGKCLNRRFHVSFGDVGFKTGIKVFWEYIKTSEYRKSRSLFDLIPKTLIVHV